MRPLNAPVFNTWKENKQVKLLEWQKQIHRPSAGCTRNCFILRHSVTNWYILWLVKCGLLDNQCKHFFGGSSMHRFLLMHFTVILTNILWTTCTWETHWSNKKSRVKKPIVASKLGSCDTWMHFTVILRNAVWTTGTEETHWSKQEKSY